MGPAPTLLAGLPQPPTCNRSSCSCILARPAPPLPKVHATCMPGPCPPPFRHAGEGVLLRLEGGHTASLAEVCDAAGPDVAAGALEAAVEEVRQAMASGHIRPLMAAEVGT